MTTQPRMILIGAIAPLVIAAAGIIAVVSVIPRLPSPVATHWGPAGGPDGFGTAISGVIIVAVVVVAYSAFAFAVASVGHDTSTVNQRIILAIGPALAAVLTAIVTGSLLIQVGLADARQAPSLTPIVVLGFAGGIAVGVLAWFLLPRSTPAAPHRGTVAAAELSPTTRVAWMQRAEPSRAVGGLVIAILVLAIGGGGIALALVAPIAVFIIWLVVMLLVAALALAFLFWKVTIDNRGMVVRSVLGFPRFTIAATDVSAAAVVTVNPPVEFGGWGIRWGGPKRIGVITRSGEALEVTRKNGRVLVVTVPQSANGAALLNALASRV